MSAPLRGLLRGSVCVRISGARPAEGLNALTRAGIAWWGCSAVDDFAMKVYINLRDLRAAGAAAARSQCALEALRERGVPAAGRRLRRRTALLCSAAVCFALLAASTLFVWDIEVTGCESVSEGEILRALADCGVESGSFWPAWDADAVKNHVILAVPELSWVGVSVAGSRAEVRVRERTEPPETASDGAPGSVAARATGIIERMEVFEGRPVAAVGDAVAEGETLVSGEMTSETGPTRYVRASARVTARTFVELTAAAPLEHTALAQRATHTRWALIFCGCRVHFYAGSSQTPPGCGKITTEYPLAVEGVFSLPVTLVRERVTEYALSPDREDEDALAEELKAELLARLGRRLGEDGEALGVNFSVSESGGLLYVTLRAECREDIAEFAPAQ